MVTCDELVSIMQFAALFPSFAEISLHLLHFSAKASCRPLRSNVPSMSLMHKIEVYFSNFVLFCLHLSFVHFFCFCVVLILAGSNVSAYVGMVCDLLRNSLPKAVVHCQVREAKRSLLDHFYASVGKREVRQFPHFFTAMHEGVKSYLTYTQRHLDLFCQFRHKPELNW